MENTDISYFKYYRIVKTNFDFHMLINDNDKYISANIRDYGVWEPHMVDKLSQYIHPGMTVVDVGANIGFHTLIMSRLVGPEGKVHSFEPCTSIHKVLLFNTILNHCLNTKIYCMGLGAKNETRYIEDKWYQNDNFDNYGLINLREENTDNTCQSIEVKSLDSLGIKFDVMKIDAEGMDYLVIQGAKEIIKKYKPIILVEVHVWDYNTMVNTLKSIDYELEYIGGFDYLAKSIDQTALNIY